VRFLAPLGLKTDQEPRPDRMAALIEQIRREGIRALFVG
jgi:ABC-type Zn uptake system ZnuABC Zn-binding protein ZnuA